MARGIGLTTEMLKNIDFYKRKLVIIVVDTNQMISHINHIVFNLFGIDAVAKIKYARLENARHNLLGYSANDVFVDHAVWDVAQTEDNKRELAWLKEFLSRATK